MEGYRRGSNKGSGVNDDL
jgi:hypothetical protein